MEDNKVCDFADTVLVKLSEVGQGLSSSCSEKHSPHTLCFAIFNGTSYELKTSIHKWLRSIVLRFVFTFMYLDWHSSLELRDHLLDELDDLKVVFKFVDVTLNLVNVLALLGYELFVVHDILFNRIEEQMHGFFLLSLDHSNILCESFNIFWFVDLDFVIYALLDQILNSSFCLITELHSCRVWQGEWLLVLVQVNEVREI